MDTHFTRLTKIRALMYFKLSINHWYKKYLLTPFCVAGTVLGTSYNMYVLTMEEYIKILIKYKIQNKITSDSDKYKANKTRITI